MITPDNLLNAKPIFIIYNNKIQMVYYEQLKLLIILVMAYFSYRKISNLPFNAIEQSGESIQPEESASEENSQLESESAGQEDAGVECEEKAEIEIDGECQQQEIPPQSLEGSSPPPTDALVPDGEENNETPNVLAEVDENESASKIGKRKLIKKSWKREKRQSTTQTIIASEEQVESEVDEQKENEMIDI